MDNIIKFKNSDETTTTAAYSVRQKNCPPPFGWCLILLIIALHSPPVTLYSINSYETTTSIASLLDNPATTAATLAVVTEINLSQAERIRHT